MIRAPRPIHCQSNLENVSRRWTCHSIKPNFTALQIFLACDFRVTLRRALLSLGTIRLCVPKTWFVLIWRKNRLTSATMIALLSFLLTLLLASPFRSKSRLEAENAALRHQLTVLRRKVRGRVQLTNDDRLLLIQLYRWFPSILQAITIIRPETLMRWHRAGLRRYWRWKSRSLGGRPQVDAELRALIRRISLDNPLWGAPRVHGELLKLGLEVAQSSVAKYMVKRCGPPSQRWRTFLSNHAADIAAMDLFVVPTIGFDLLYALVIVRLARRDLVCDQRHSKSDCGMDCTPNHGGIPLG